MSKQNIAEMKRQIYRRIGLRTAVLAIWAAGLVALVFTGEAGELKSTYLYMTFALGGVWAVYLMRDWRYLKSDELLKKQAIERNDERMVLITYKATRMAAVILLCALPVVICALSVFGMQEAVDTLAVVVACFAVVYLISWAYFSKTC